MNTGAMDQLPHNTAFEQSIVSYLLNYSETAEEIFRVISAADFYHVNHQVIFQTAHGLFLKGAPVDLPSMGTAILEAGLTEKTGGSVYLAKLLNECPVPSSVEYYCQKLRELAERRRLVIECNTAMRDACDQAKPLDEVHRRLEEIAKAADDDRKSRVPTIEALAVTDAEWNGASLTPDCIVENYQYADVGVFSAPGGTGKTTLWLYEAIHVVLERRLYGLEVRRPGRCLLITAEDPRPVLVARLRKICEAMGLSPAEIEAVRRGVLIYDVSGLSKKLVGLKDGNIVTTAFADEIISAYGADPLVSLTIDPTVSFGIGEGRVNENEQGLIAAARRIRNGLGCCVRFIHHVGKQNARDKALDQYASRGGSALPDGCRMVAVLQAWDPHNNTLRPPQGLNYSPESTITILARPKLSYAPANLPLIWLKRTGWTFECFTETFVPDEVRERATLDQVARYIRSAEAQGIHYTKTELESACGEMGLKRQELRDARNKLIAEGRLVEKDLPIDEQSTKRKTYLGTRQDSAGFQNETQSTTKNNAGETPKINPAAYRENPGGRISRPDLPHSLDPAAIPRQDSAGLAELPRKDAWEDQI